MRSWPARAVDLVVQVIARVLVDPVRRGRLRSQGWPRGLAPVVTVTLVLYAVLAVVTVAGPLLRRTLPVGSAAFGIPAELLGPATAVTVLLVAVLSTAALHAPLLLRLAGLAAPLLLFSSQAQLATDPGQLVWSAAGLVALGVLMALRSGRGFAWWELVVVLAVVGGVATANLVTIVQPALEASAIDPSFLVYLTIVAVGVFGLGYTVTSGAAISEVAVSTSAWFVEYLRLRFAPLTQLAVLAVAAVVAWAVQLLRLADSPVPAQALAVGVLIAATLLLLTLLSWLLLDRALDARDRRAGTPAQDTDLGDIADAFRGLAIAVGLALAAPHAATIVWGNLERGLRVPLAALGVDYVPTDLVSRLTGGISDGRWLLVASDLLAVVICVVVTIRATRRRQRGRAELALVVGLFGLVAAAGTAGVPFLDGDLDVLATAALLITTVAAARWLLTRTMTIRRLHAAGVALLLSAAVSGRELLADPLGWLLGSAGGALLVFGLVWNLLTGAEDANGDSRRFPRATRTLVVVGYLTTAMFVAAADAIAVSFAVDLDRFVLLGAEVIGTALLATATWAVLSTGARDAPTVEPR